MTNMCISAMNVLFSYVASEASRGNILFSIVRCLHLSTSLQLQIYFNFVLVCTAKDRINVLPFICDMWQSRAFCLVI